MRLSNDFQVATVLRRGIGLFKSTFKSMIKYSFLAVLISSMTSIYMYLIEIVGEKNEMLYIIGLILLVLLLLPIIYYSVRVVATTVDKLKAAAFGESFNYKERYGNSKEIFWRVTLILFLKFVLIIVFIVSCILPAMTFSNFIFKNFDTFWNIEPILLGMANMLSILFALTSLFILARIEFAMSVIYWNVESEYSDIVQSFKMTKHHLFKKLLVIFMAHLPNLILVVITININNSFDGFTGRAVLGLGNLLLTIAANTIIFTWMYSIYLAMFEAMGSFTLSQLNQIDNRGREWLTF